MNCEQFRDMVHDWERKDAMELSVRLDGVRHAESCTACARFLAEAQALTDSLQELAESSLAEQASPALEEKLRRAFRARRVSNPALRPALPIALRKRPWIPAVLAGAIAAAVLVAVGIGVRSRHGSSQSPGVAAQNASSGQVSRPPAGGANHPSPETKRRGPARKERQRPAERIPVPQAELATDFVPLPGADNLAALRDAAVVRLQVSPAVLASMGLPVGGDPSVGAVTADFVVSEDGTPEAVRLIQ